MSKFKIIGGKPLKGTIPVYGSKNAALPLLAASLLSKEPVKLTNIPAILDVSRLLEIFRTMGAEAAQNANEISVSAANLDPKKLPQDLVGHLRGSILLMGALLGRCRQVDLPLPGGDVIGARPIDVHLDAFEQLGARTAIDDHIVHIDGANLKPGRVVMREFSVTATENLMLAAAALPGQTTIEIAAAEPHVVALAGLLNKMGANIAGAGTHTITIEGVRELHGASFENIPDMIEAGSFILLAAAAQAPLTITNVPVCDLLLFFKKLDDIGVAYDISGSSVSIKPSALKAFKIQTLPYPGLPTDLQAPFSVVATQADGASLIHDPMYEGRFKYVDELAKMGAKITVCDPHRVIIEGPAKLTGRHMKSLDIRAGVTLIWAGLIASGETIIDGADIIDRGYANLVERLENIGAAITRVS